MPPLNSISTKCSGQRPLWKKSPRSYNLPKPFETLKSENKFKKIGSKRTNQKVTKFPETSATLRSSVGFQIFVVKPLFTFLSSIGPFTKKGAILCSQLVLWLVNVVWSGPVKWSHGNTCGKALGAICFKVILTNFTLQRVPKELKIRSRLSWSQLKLFSYLSFAFINR